MADDSQKVAWSQAQVGSWDAELIVMPVKALRWTKAIASMTRGNA